VTLKSPRITMSLHVTKLNAAYSIVVVAMHSLLSRY